MKILTSIAVCVLSICISIPVMADENSDALNTLDALNHAIVSIYRVEKRPSKVTVDEEYNAIINNIAWGNIKDDSEFQDLIREMMNAYTENRLESKEREMLRRQYEVQVNRAFLEVKPLSHLQTEAAVNTAQQLSGSLFGGLLSAAASGVGEFTMALQTHERMKMQAQGQEQEYMQQRIAGEWELDKAKIRRFNTLKTSLLTAVWTLLNRYNLPDEARLTEDNLDQFYAFISEKDVAKALRMGKRLETNFSKYPPYWFYLGSFYLQKGDSQEARACFDKFEEVNRPILRKDTFAAAAARYKIFTLNEKEVDEAKRLVGIIEKQAAADDWNTVLFAALQNYQLGDKKKAEDLLLQNIDNGFNVPLNTEILHQMQKGKFDLSAVQGVAIRQFKEPSQLEKLAKAGNAEAQYAYGSSFWSIQQAYPWMEQAAKQGHFFAQCWLIRMAPKDHEKEIKNVFTELKEKSDKGNAEAQLFLGLFYQNGIGTSKDEKKAFTLYQKSAEQGLASAQFYLGNFYDNGIGTAKDDRKSFAWYQKAAEQGLAAAQCNLGVCYEDGIGTTKDVKKAFFWYQKAAEQGNAVAQCNLGLCYENGIGTTKDERKAFAWYQKAAEQGIASAQFRLGVCYMNGEGTTKDEQKAFTWYLKAAEQGYAAAQGDLGFCYMNGIGTTKDEQKAFFWTQKSAEQGYVVAQSNLGLCYVNGIGTSKDTKKAFSWFQKAAEQGAADAQYNLSLCYMNCDGTTKDEQKAFFWTQKSAEQGCVVAQCNLGLCYVNGIGTSKDTKKAFSWFQKAAEQGAADAQYYLGLCYMNGDGTTKDEQKAFFWTRKSAEQGNAHAQVNLGFHYENGIGTSKDTQKAFAWYLKAAEQGDAIAQCTVGTCYLLGIGTTKNKNKAHMWYQKAAEQGNSDAIKCLESLLNVMSKK